VSTADLFAQETTNAVNALGEAHSAVAGLAHGDTSGAAVQDPAYLAHALSEFRLATSQVEFILAGLHRRISRAVTELAAQHQQGTSGTYPAAVLDLTAALANGLHSAHSQAHNTWRELGHAEDHAAAIKTATRANPTRSPAADRFAAQATHTANALGAAHTILAGLNQSHYGGRAVLDAAVLAHTVARLRETTSSLELILHVVARHTNHLAATQDYPDAVGERVASLASALVAASTAARATTRVLRPMEAQALQLRTATAGTHFAL
jgi:cellobiose-specific phosphotransferase system component IIA